ncbi:efflux RND transporter periplasmic adaptor subunit [Bradyrhizobium sp. U87765 SZCCT0131]|uniref:efflux RND transporter periplasmic adaptor subunit n=1 Tax=unclassified Bradyrhizobium TaxID=2631580 RepID=UPI001BA9FC06|nr:MULTISPECIES: efflux RND transporter periplasmic adaptor subunit [unclassified Bradyrhizobium]MBR1218912.1 efflux RND transporter periplasmic adaptor subunit [Bradyrhizobium sp. U87765 SZCCT0131]MBR1261563.1 efflux RND transporter periplasmic adaptor subunit [Bradyrhizobium sp. U87765 SZCCT0134]MBR1306584.1 efflux RND transporter periplasmic adaptor subunit [Bradyrhizobium sp. U87765 SZCCT0110]MBR1317345.1 efflux RND transporter periplasmic adaptor subunit [Bradyrhizobium sp. U87765 SZCCT010
MMSSRILLALLGGAAALMLGGCKEEAAVPVPVRPVLSMVVEPGLAGGAAIVGTVQPQFKTDLGFRVLGRLIARPVNVGDMVEKGQVVASVDPAALELAVRSATAAVSSAQAQLANAAGAEGRQRTLLETEATSRATFETAEQARAAAQASVVQAEANLTKAREQLGYARLKADFAGVVTAVGAEVGQVVSPGQSVVTVARPDIREAVIDVSEDIAASLRIGQTFTVSLQLNPAIKAEGKVREIAPQADQVTRTRRVRITLETPPEAFRLGTTVTTTLAGSDARVLRLPGSAVLTRDGKTYVWLVDTASRTVALREVQGAPDDGGLRVTGGIAPGVRVVTAGVHSLKEGQKVRIDQEAQQ